jgi:hypothetical protein
MPCRRNPAAKPALKKEVRLRLVLSSILLAALAAHPCFAKDGHSQGHAQHGARASAADKGASGKGAGGNGTSVGVNAAPRKADTPIDTEAAIAPPVLPPHGLTQQQIRITNPGAKTPSNPVSRATMGPTPIQAARNAIGQPVIPSKNIAVASPPLPAPQRSGVVVPPIIHGGSAAPPVSSGTARLNVANNRGSVNGATVIRPANGPSGIGGPAAARYGIDGTTVRNKH